MSLGTGTVSAGRPSQASMTRHSTLALCAVAAIGLAACGTSSAAPAPSPSGTIRISQRVDMSGGAYIEGYLAFARVTHTDGSEVFEVEVPYRKAVVRDVEPGSYRLVFTVRPCDANCGNLDPVAERCSSSFDVRAGDVTDLTVVVQAGHGCQVTIG